MIESIRENPYYELVKGALIQDTDFLPDLLDNVVDESCQRSHPLGQLFATLLNETVKSLEAGANKIDVEPLASALTAVINHPPPPIAMLQPPPDHWRARTQQAQQKSHDNRVIRGPGRHSEKNAKKRKATQNGGNGKGPKSGFGGYITPGNHRR